MPDDTCSTCRFWKPNRAGGRSSGDGKCRRYAPRSANQAILFGAEAIIAIADLLSRHHGIEWPNGIEAEPTETTHAVMFPGTYDDDWCGEHQPSTDA